MPVNRQLFLHLSGKHHAFQRTFPLGQGLNSTLKYEYVTALLVDDQLFLCVSALHALKNIPLLRKVTWHFCVNLKWWHSTPVEFIRIMAGTSHWTNIIA